MVWGAYLLGIATGIVGEFLVIVIWTAVSRALVRARLELRLRYANRLMG